MEANRKLRLAMLLIDFFRDVYRPIRLRGRSSRTVTLYLRSIAAYSGYLGREATMADLEDVAVAQYLTSLESHLAPHTIAKERSQLLAMWTCAAKRRYVDRWPDIPAPPLPRRTPIAWTAAELRQLLDACRRERGEYCGVPAADWWVALHLVIWDCAERIGAISRIEWRDLRGDWLIVRAELRKGRRSDACHRLGKDTMAALEKIRQPARDAVFPWPYSLTYLWHVYGLICAAAWLPDDRKHKFHCLRKSVASHLKKAGGDPQAVLDHLDARTTQAYLDPRIVDAPQPADLLFRLTDDDEPPRLRVKAG